LSDKLVGTYNLRSFEVRKSDGSVGYPLGKNAVGRITYDDAGCVAVQVMRAGRPKFASGDMLGGTPDEVFEAWAGFVSYAGRYKIDESAGTVTHQIDICSFPNWVGQNQIRHFRFEGSTLEVTTPPLAYGGDSSVAASVWERA
jgi:hypothetical protein